MMTRQTTNRLLKVRRGFTLTEVLLVLAILGVIAAMIIPNLLARQQDAYKKTTKINISALENAAKQYAISHEGAWPNDINTLLNPGTDKDGKPIAAFLEKPPKDAWGVPLYFEYPSSKAGDKPGIWSSGPNRSDEGGGGDDISSWVD